MTLSCLHSCEAVQAKIVLMVISEWLPLSVPRRHGQFTSWFIHNEMLLQILCHPPWLGILLVIKPIQNKYKLSKKSKRSKVNSVFGCGMGSN